MTTYTFIDASNLFYGGEKSLGWKIDYQKLLNYLKEKYLMSRALYFGGVEIRNFEFNYLENETVPIYELEKYLVDVIKNKANKLNEAELLLIGRHLQRVRFYLKLKEFGYELHLKPVDGDFLPVLKHLRNQGKEIIILARGPRTAKEIRQFAAAKFRDFEYLKYRLKYEE